MGQTMMQMIPAGSMPANCYFIYDDDTKELLIADPAGDADKLKQRITEYGLKPVAILLTHGHFDHIGAVDELRAEYGIKVYCMEEEKEVLENVAYNLSTWMGEGFTVKPDVLLTDGQELVLAGMRIRVIATPGHTRGSCCYYFEQEEKEHQPHPGDFLLSGDTLFAESYGRTDFPTGSMSQLTRSIKEKLFVLPDETPVYTGHGEPTSIEHEKRYNPI